VRVYAFNFIHLVEVAVGAEDTREAIIEHHGNMN